MSSWIFVRACHWPTCWADDFREVGFSPTAESFGVSAQIESGVVPDGPEVRFHERSTRVPSGFREVLRGVRGGAPHAVGDVT